jgi:hypothetical protein
VHALTALLVLVSAVHVHVSMISQHMNKSLHRSGALFCSCSAVIQLSLTQYRLYVLLLLAEQVSVDSCTPGHCILFARC